MASRKKGPTPLCVAPFVNARYKHVLAEWTPCCSIGALNNWTHSGESFESSLKNFWASKELRQLRYQLLEGRWPSACEVCEHLEKNGMPSDRIVHWKLQKQLGLAESITYDLYTGNEHAQPLTLDVRPSNVCNLKCRMCTASNSSRIQQELDSHSELKQFSKDISDRWPQSKPASEFF